MRDIKNYIYGKPSAVNTNHNGTRRFWFLVGGHRITHKASIEHQATEPSVRLSNQSFGERFRMPQKHLNASEHKKQTQSGHKNAKMPAS